MSRCTRPESDSCLVDAQGGGQPRAGDGVGEDPHYTSPALEFAVEALQVDAAAGPALVRLGEREARLGVLHGDLQPLGDGRMGCAPNARLPAMLLRRDDLTDARNSRGNRILHLCCRQGVDCHAAQLGISQSNQMYQMPRGSARLDRVKLARVL